MKITLGELLECVDEIKLLRVNEQIVRQSQIADYGEKHKDAEVGGITIFAFDNGIGLDVVV